MYIKIANDDLSDKQSSVVDVFGIHFIRLALINMYIKQLMQQKRLSPTETRFINNFISVTDIEPVKSLNLADIKTFDLNCLIKNFDYGLKYIKSKEQRDSEVINRLCYLSNNLNKKKNNTYVLGEDGVDYITEKKAVSENVFNKEYIKNGFKIFLQFMNDVTKLAEFRGTLNRESSYFEHTNGEPAYIVLCILLATDSYCMANNSDGKYYMTLNSELLSLGYHQELYKYFKQYNSIGNSFFKTSYKHDLEKPFTPQRGAFSPIYIDFNVDNNLYYSILGKDGQYNSLTKSAFWKQLDLNRSSLDYYAKAPYLLFREMIYILNIEFDFFPGNEENPIPLRTADDLMKIIVGDTDENGIFTDYYTIDGVTKKCLRAHIPSICYEKEYWENFDTLSQWLRSAKNKDYEKDIVNLPMFEGYAYNSSFYNFEPDFMEEKNLTVDEKLELLLDLHRANMWDKITNPIMKNSLHSNIDTTEFNNKFLRLITDFYCSQFQSSRFREDSSYTTKLNELLNIYKQIYIDKSNITNPNVNIKTNEWMSSIHTQKEYVDVLPDLLLYCIEILREQFENLNARNELVYLHSEAVISRYFYMFGNNTSLNKKDFIDLSKNEVMYYGISLYQCLGEVVTFTDVTTCKYGTTIYEGNSIVLSLPVWDKLLVIIDTMHNFDFKLVDFENIKVETIDNMIKNLEVTINE